MSEYPKEVEWKKPDTKNTLFHLFKIQKLRKLIGGDRVKIEVNFQEIFWVKVLLSFLFVHELRFEIRNFE